MIFGLAGAHPLAAMLLAGWTALVTPRLAAHDFAEHRLPNAIVLPGWPVAGIALVTAWAEAGAFPLAAAVAGVVAALSLGALAFAGGLGMGDAKLAAPLAVGLALAHPGRILVAAAVALAAGALLALAELARTRDRRARVPFGPPLLLGFWSGWVA